jgi:MFS family permease
MMKQNTKIGLATNIGAILEYYDYIIFALLTPYIAQAFFPNHQAQAAFLNVVFIFFLGSCARLVGGILIGSICDRYSRRDALLVCIFLMAGSTLAIAVLPTHATLGVWAGVLLTFFRFLQGLAYSVEIPITTVFFKEFHSQQAGYRTSILVSCTSLGAILAGSALSLLTLYYDDITITQGLWRIPLLLGALLGVVGCCLRRNLPEEQGLLSPTPITKANFPSLIKGIFIMLMPATLIVISLFFPTTLSTAFGYSSKDIYRCGTIGLVVAAICSPIWGLAIDKYGYRILSFWMGILFLAIHPLNYQMLTLQNSHLLTYFSIIYQILLVGYINLSLAATTALSSSNFRGRITSISYNTAFVLANLAFLETMFKQPIWSLLVIPLFLAIIASGLMSAPAPKGQKL